MKAEYCEECLVANWGFWFRAIRVANLVSDLFCVGLCIRRMLPAKKFECFLWSWLDNHSVVAELTASPPSNSLSSEQQR
jgi:hypothetical protein